MSAHVALFAMRDHLTGGELRRTTPDRVQNRSLLHGNNGPR